MVSAVSPGPNDMAQPGWPACACSMISRSTNITVAEDMFPNRASTLA